MGSSSRATDSGANCCEIRRQFIQRLKCRKSISPAMILFPRFCRVMTEAGRSELPIIENPDHKTTAMRRAQANLCITIYQETNDELHTII
jgi:hypothetical protein